MRRALPTFLAVLLTGLAVSAQSGDTIVIRGGRLFDGVADQCVPNTAIVVRGGVFQSVGEPWEGVESEDVTLLELDPDDTVLPGLFDLHAHFAVDLFGRGRVDETAVNPRLFLANGATSVFPAGEVDPDEMLALRRSVDAGDTIGPRILNSGPYFGRWRRGWNEEVSADELRAEVDRCVEDGARGFKAKGISAKHLRVLIEQAHRHGLTVTGHLDSGFRSSVNPREAIAMGIDRVEHFLGGDMLAPDRSAYASLEEFDPETPQGRAQLEAIIELYVARGVYFDATMSAYGYWAEKDPEVFTTWEDETSFFTEYVRGELAQRRPRRPIAQFETIYWLKRRTLKAFYDGGGAHLITLGTDHPSWGEFLAAFGVHRELHSFVLSGIPPAAALKMATINGARAMGVGDRLGSIEPGKLADFVVVRGDPLEDIRATRDTRWVMVAGRLHDARGLLESCRGRVGPENESERDAWGAR